MMTEWWYCENCGEVCQTHEVKKVWMSLTDDPRDKEEYWLCPHCHGDYLEEAEECARCGIVLPKEELIDGVCDACGEAIIKEWKESNRKRRQQQNQLTVGQ